MAANFEKPQNQANNNGKTPKAAEGWLNLTLVDPDGNLIGKIGGVPLDDSNPLHAAINAAMGEFDPDACRIEVTWNSGKPKHQVADFASLFKRKG